MPAVSLARAAAASAVVHQLSAAQMAAAMSTCSTLAVCAGKACDERARQRRDDDPAGVVRLELEAADDVEPLVLFEPRPRLPPRYRTAAVTAALL